MTGKVKDKMVEGAMALLAQRGLQATSFSEVLAATGAPRGSLYHHFPGGKDQLVVAAMDRASIMLSDALESAADQPTKVVVERFLAIWRSVLTRSQCEAGCAILAVTVAADSEELLEHARMLLSAWQDRLADLLTDGGMKKAQAKSFAIMLIASVEGAVVLARAERSMEPFEVVAKQLLRQVSYLE